MLEDMNRLYIFGLSGNNRLARSATLGAMMGASGALGGKDKVAVLPDAIQRQKLAQDRRVIAQG